MSTRHATVCVLITQSLLLALVTALNAATNTPAGTSISKLQSDQPPSAFINSNSSPVPIWRQQQLQQQQHHHHSSNTPHRTRRHDGNRNSNSGPSSKGIYARRQQQRQQQRQQRRQRQQRQRCSYLSAGAINWSLSAPAEGAGYAPTILVSEDAVVQTVELHKSHVIECVHEAEPTATVVWYHNNEPIETDGHHHQALGSELVFLETSEHDEGIYRCKASNKFGSATSPEFSLSVTKPNKPPQINHIRQHNVRPSIKFESSVVKGNKPMDIVCEAPNDEKIIWKVNDRQFFAQTTQTSEDPARNSFQYSVQDNQFAFDQRIGNLMANNQREYILTMLLKHSAATHSQHHISINITCAYQYVKEGAFKWMNSDPGQLVVISQDTSVRNYSDVGQNGTYRVPIDIDMAPPFENLINGSINGFNRSLLTNILETSEKPGTLWNVHDRFVSMTRQHFIPVVLVPTLVLITLIMLVILFVWRRRLAARETSAYKRDQQHHKSYQRHFQVQAPLQNNLYPPGYYPYAQQDKQIPYIPSQMKATHHRSHDLGKSLRTNKTWSLFPSSKKHTQLINPFMGADSRQLSMINNAQCYPSLNGSSRGIDLLPRILHSSLSQNNFATAYSTNYIDMRCATPQQNSNQGDQFLASQHRINQQFVMDSDQSRFANNNNQTAMMHSTSKNVMYDAPSDGTTPTSTSSASSLTNTISGQVINRPANLKGGSQSILTSNNTYLSGDIKRSSDDKKMVTNYDPYSLDQRTFKDSDHHYSTIAEANNKCPDNNQMDACYEDLDRHQVARNYLGTQTINKNQISVVGNQVVPGESFGTNDSFRSRISSFLAHQNNGKRNSGASSSTRSSRSASKFNHTNNGTYDNQQQQPHPYAVASIRGVTPTPPPPPMSEAMKTLNEQFNLDQLIIFNNNGINGG